MATGPWGHASRAAHRGMASSWLKGLRKDRREYDGEKKKSRQASAIGILGQNIIITQSPVPKCFLSTAAQWDRPPATGNKIKDDFPFLVRAVRPVARPLSHPLLLLLRARLVSFFKHASSLVGAFNGDVIFIRQPCVMSNNVN